MTKYLDYSTKALLWLIIMLIADGLLGWIAAAGCAVAIVASGIELVRETKARRQLREARSAQ